MRSLITFFLLFFFTVLAVYPQDGWGNHFVSYGAISHEEGQATISDNIIATAFTFGLIALTVGFNVWMREGVYANNHSNNWWGTVNGAFSLGLAGMVAGYGISYLAHIISNRRFDEMHTLSGAVIGMVCGIALAFFPPFRLAFRENAFLYYSFPALMVIGFLGVGFDIWFGDRERITLGIEPTLNSGGQGISLLLTKRFP